MSVFNDISPINSPHIIIQWIKSWGIKKPLTSWNFSVIHSCVTRVTCDSADSSWNTYGLPLNTLLIQDFTIVSRNFGGLFDAWITYLDINFISWGKNNISFNFKFNIIILQSAYKFAYQSAYKYFRWSWLSELFWKDRRWLSKWVFTLFSVESMQKYFFRV